MEYGCDDEELIDEACSGNLRAFNRLVECNQEKLFASMLRFLGCREDAEEAVQDAFVRAFTRLNTFNRDAKFSTWLYRIAFNSAIGNRRKRRSNISLESRIEQTGTEPIDQRAQPVDQRLLREEEIALVHRALDQLSDDHRAILILREMDDLAYEEIAKVLSISVGTVRSRLSRARERLREVLEAINGSFTELENPP